VNLFERVSRSAQVTRTATRVFASHRWNSFRSKALPPDEAERRLAALHRENAERIYQTVTELRGLLIKVGQIMGARADIFPDEYVEILSRLHDEVPPHPFPIIREAVERELQEPLESVFAEFSPEPIASASLAQVHKARLKDGREAAVKVQYPEIEEIVRVDLQNVRLLVRAANRLIRDFDLTPIVEELNANVPLELDFLNEGRNAEITAANFAGNDEFIVPRIYWEHTTRRVLTMEFVHGIKITDRTGLEQAGIDPQDVASLLANGYMRQIFSHGFFHADPHPGNLFVQPGPKLVIVDFGLAKKLSPEFVQGFIRLTTALVAGDSAALARSFRELGFKTRRPDDTIFEALGEAMVTRLSRNGEFSRDRQMLLEFQQRMLRIFRENPVVRVPGEFLLIGRVMGLLSGVGAQLGSKVNLLDVVGGMLAEQGHTQAPASPS
jgi:predicted unusual protein kinase regulating ubiquinone biosynthesis (AarF/ABC1/UbiB family)